MQQKAGATGQSECTCASYRRRLADAGCCIKCRRLVRPLILILHPFIIIIIIQSASVSNQDFSFNFFTMYALYFLTAAASACNALAIRNKHVSDFRVFGDTGCKNINLGVWTVIDDDIGPSECKIFADDPVKSIFLTDLNDECTSRSTLAENGTLLTRQCRYTRTCCAALGKERFKSVNAWMRRRDGRRGQ